MTTTHTPGPWTVITENKGLSLGITNDQSVPIASRIVDQSNARLIAAAPDLLAALMDTVPALIRLGDFVGNVDDGGPSGQGRIDRCALVLKVRAAIAKAEGAR